MIKHCLWMCLCLLAALPVGAQESTPSSNVQLIITGFKNNAGFARIAVADNKQDFMNEDKAFCLIKSRITNHAVRMTLSLPPGTYAISCYHDENGNGVLDRNMVGMPSEAYGFSNNVRGLVSPPAFEKAGFVLGKSLQSMEITVK